MANVSSSNGLEKRPKLRFPGFDEPYKQCRIGDIYAERSQRGASDMELLSVTMNDGVKPRSEIEGKDNSSEDKSNYKIVRKGDMVYNSMRMWQGANGISPCDGIVSPAYTVLMPKQEINNGYFAALFKSANLINEFRKNSQGMTSDTWNLKYPQIETIKVQIPSVSEQYKVSEMFSVLDERIAAQSQLVESLKKYKRGLSKAVFSTNSELFPKSTVASLGELFPFIRNGFVGTVTPFFTSQENGVRYLQGTNIHDGKISDETAFYVTQAFNQKHSKNILKSNDILVVQSGHVGECAVVGDNYAGSNCHALIIMSNGGECASDYICQYINSDDGKKKIAAITTGNTIKHILATSIANIEVPLPSKKDQQRIAELLNSWDNRIEQEIRNLCKLVRIKEGLLQQLFI